eukprot:GDKI01002413.1.p1 GENE.GDKI01002413.1~~GDKI01002413.1.p1  ORF type:complete len:167 (-),score=17.28 GDKI01002413.1:159-659(-)
MSVLVKSHRVFEQCTIVLFFVRWLVIPLYIVPHYATILNVLPMLVSGGYYLAFFFVISHNFKGVRVNHTLHTQKTDTSFLRRQVLTASNVGGVWLCFLNGGLNYQIERHLFPRIQHTLPFNCTCSKAILSGKGHHIHTLSDSVRKRCVVYPSHVRNGSPTVPDRLP